MRIFMWVFMLTILFVAGPVAAQGLPDDDPLNVSITPAYPQPFADVTISVSSNLIDLASSVITISTGGAAVNDGARTAQVRAGGSGSRTNVSVSVKTADGLTYSKQVTIAPSDVALVIEPRSTTHLLYKGAALVAPEGSVRIVAIPDLRTSSGMRIPAQNLVYTWRLGERVLEGSSGIGRSVLTATAPVRYRDAEISVTVASQDQTAAGSASVDIAATSPLLRIYRHDPLLGVNFDTALAGTYPLAGEEDGLRAVPYFFKEMPGLAWSVGGASGGTDPDITLRETGGGAGTTALDVRATLGLENAEAGLTIQFGQDLVSNFFGR